MNAPATDAPSSATAAARHGAITVICGCMFSGKTTELLRRLAEFSPGASLALRHVIDDRYSADAIVSHAGKASPARSIASPKQIVTYLDSRVELVAIDEGHFFDMSLVDAISDLAAGGVNVIAASLDRDSWGRSFTIARRLCAIADEPIVKHAVCARCNRVADRTQRLKPILNGNMVGGPESYEPRCQRCWRPPPEPPPPPV